MKTIKRSFFFSIIITAFSFTAHAQDEIKAAIESKQFVFIADKIHPQSGISRVLSSSYDLNITPGKVVAYLPYYGRVYTPMLNTDGGIKFTSSDFEYSKTAMKDGWEISIRPKDVPLVSRLQLTIFDNGTASLYVTSSNRESISYSGKVRAKVSEKRGF